MEIRGHHSFSYVLVVPPTASFCFASLEWSFSQALKDSKADWFWTQWLQYLVSQGKVITVWLLLSVIWSLPPCSWPGGLFCWDRGRWPPPSHVRWLCDTVLLWRTLRGTEGKFYETWNSLLTFFHNLYTVPDAILDRKQQTTPWMFKALEFCVLFSLPILVFIYLFFHSFSVQCSLS